MMMCKVATVSGGSAIRLTEFNFKTLFLLVCTMCQWVHGNLSYASNGPCINCRSSNLLSFLGCDAFIYSELFCIIATYCLLLCEHWKNPVLLAPAPVVLI